MSENVLPNKHARKSVAVPDSHEAGARYRLGVKSDGPDATFALGEKGPGGQRLASVYVTAEDAFLSVNLDEGTITVISGADDKLQAVTYDIDAQAMHGGEIQVGETFSVIFKYDDKRFIDETPIVTEWLATTGPQYPNLADRLPVDETVAIFGEQVETAKGLGHSGRASRAPKTATQVVEEHLARTAAEAELAAEALLPSAIQMTDPQTDMTFVGRVWERPGETTTVNELVAAGYRIAMVEFASGEKAILLPNFRGGLGIEIKTHGHLIERVLDPTAMDTKLGPGERFDTMAISSFDGDRTQGGPFASPPMKYVAALGQGVDAGVDPGYRDMPFLKEFRGNQHDFTLAS